MTFEVCHGCLDREKRVPNTFRVDFEGHFKSCCAAADSLGRTIDYASVYEAVKYVMEGTSRNLLETLASEMIDRIRARVPGFLDIRIAVSKKNPPLGGCCDKATVEEYWKAEEEVVEIE